MTDFSDRDGVIWLDGKMLDWREANIHVLTHSLHYGLAVFEGVRAYQTPQGPAIFRLQDHTRRLFGSAKIVNMQIPYSQEELQQAQLDVVKQNKFNAAYLRPLCFFGSSGMGLRTDNQKVHVCVASWEWDSYLGAENLQKGIRIKTSSYTRHHVNSAMCRAKISGNYVNSTLALNEALAEGYAEALLLDKDGFVTEGSGENFFMIRDGKIYTPDLTSALDGITRNTVMQLALDAGIEVLQCRITRDDVYTADEAFFTGTAAEVTPINELDRRVIGNGLRGPITQCLQAAYFDLVEGRSSKKSEWLTYV